MQKASIFCLFGFAGLCLVLTLCWFHQITVEMKMLSGYYLCLLLLLSCLNEPAESGTLHLDSCSVHVHTHELRKYYSDMRSDVVSISYGITFWHLWVDVDVDVETHSNSNYVFYVFHITDSRRHWTWSKTSGQIINKECTGESMCCLWQLVYDHVWNPYFCFIFQIFLNHS